MKSEICTHGRLTRPLLTRVIPSREPKIDTTVIVHFLGGFPIEIGD
jgi:hypothetical protein